MSAAVELIKWTNYRETDITVVRNAIKYARIDRRAGADRKAMAANLNMIHHAVQVVRIDVRQIDKEVANLSLCETHPTISECNCVAPF